MEAADLLFAFDEGLGTIFARAGGLGIQLRPHVDAGRLEIRQVDPAEMSPGEFASIVRETVEKQNARVVLIDSLNGYLNAMPNEKFLILQMHELLSYLNQLGVVTILVLAQHGLMGPMQSPLDISYLSDTVILLRYFEADGLVRRALSVVKKRSGGHEYTIREFRLGEGGVQVGPVRQRGPVRRDPAEEALRERLARGEIDQAEFLVRMRALHDGDDKAIT